LTLRVVIVGGGAGGLELATKLGDRYEKRGEVNVTLVEHARTHFWKPHLHQLAAGSMDVRVYETDYLAQAHWHHFRFVLGAMEGLDRARHVVRVAPFVDEDGEPVTPRRDIEYDRLVIAVGSRTNDFGTPGARQYAISLDDPDAAERFHRRLVNAFMRAHAQHDPLSAAQLRIAIIGAGATGVELAAELHNAARTLVSFGLDRVDVDRQLELVLIEAAPRILPALPVRIADPAARLLANMHVAVRTSARVAAVRDDGVELADGQFIPAELVVWAAGVEAPAFLRDLDGLETNRLNQLVVRPTLQTTRDDDVFAIGDCAACPWLRRDGTATVPPRAQAAHQQASHMVKQVGRILRGQPLRTWRYRDFGSLVSLGRYSTIGNLMGTLTRGNIWLEGWLARMMYLSLYKMHELALHGFWKTTLDTLARMITRRTEPHVKLH
jgi:NADH dehydrogenase